MATAAVMLADGCEPIEALTPVDVLRRGGVKVTTVSVMGRADVTAAHDITVVADALLEQENLSAYDIVIIPGGSVGVENLGACEPVRAEITRRMEAGEPVAAICAGPMILADLGVLEGRRAVCYPGCETDFPAGVYQAGEAVVVDGNLITGSGPGTALPFALAILEALAGPATAKQVAEGMLYA